MRNSPRALGGLTGGTGSVDTTNGNVTITAANMTDTITVDGTVTHSVFGIQTRTRHAVERQRDRE